MVGTLWHRKAKNGRSTERSQRLLSPTYVVTTIQYTLSVHGLGFLKRNNKLVWDETIRIVQGLVDDVWKDQDVITLEHCVPELTLPVKFPSNLT